MNWIFYVLILTFALILAIILTGKIEKRTGRSRRLGMTGFFVFVIGLMASMLTLQYFINLTVLQLSISAGVLAGSWNLIAQFFVGEKNSAKRKLPTENTEPL